MRRYAAVVLGAVTLLGILAVPANAVPDPAAAIDCLVQAPGDITGIIDPTSPSLPSEIPVTGCVAP
ncbi:hypothetical protein [Streptomyces sp. NPDC003006]